MELSSMKYLVTALFAFAALGCATTHPGTLGHTVDGPGKLSLKISAKTVDNPIDDPFQAVEVTIENTGDEWLRIQRGDVIIQDPVTTKLSVVVGQDLQDWAVATKLKHEQDDYNSNLTKNILVLAGSAAMAAGSATGNSGLTAVGAASALGGAGWTVVSGVGQTRRQVERAEPVPENYLTAPCSVPGHLYSRRWILLNKPSHTLINHLVVEIETVEGQKEKYEIPL